MNPDTSCRAIDLVELYRIWLADGSGHANSLISLLDGTESLLAEETAKFKKSSPAYS